MEFQPLHLRLREARKKLGLKQAALAKEVGKSTSVICQLEKGKRRALSEEKVKKLCEFLKVDYVPPGESPESPLLLAERGVLAVCKNEGCPMANFSLEDGVLIIQPKMFRIWDSAALGPCIYCKQQLETGCSKCLTPLVEGAAFCFGCEKPLVRLSQRSLDEDKLEGYVKERVERRNRFLSNQPTELPRAVQKNSKPAV